VTAQELLSVLAVVLLISLVAFLVLASMKLRTATASVFLFLLATCGANAFEVFKSDDGTFQVEFPDKPTLEDLSITNLPMRYWNVEKDDKFWSAGYSEFLTIQDDLIRLETLSPVSIARRIGGTLLEDKMISFRGLPGREIIIQTVDNGKQSILLTRYFVLGKRQYSISYSGLKGTEREAAVSRFLDSFSLF
jgi:hypothetical protein